MAVKHSYRRRLFEAAGLGIALVLAVAGCGGTGGGGGGLPRGIGSSAMWVANSAGASVLSFTSAQLNVGGNVAPGVTFSGATTTLVKPTCVAFDAGGNLWVVNSLGTNSAGSVLKFSSGTLTNGGNVAPAVTISGANTTLADPEGCAFDGSGNLWVANFTPTANGTNNVVEFSSAQLVNGGNVTPAVQIGGVSTLLCNSNGLAFDGSGNLWVTNACGQTVQFKAANLPGGGNVAPANQITGPTSPSALQFDSTGNLWIAFPGLSNTVSMYAAANLGNNNPAASASISGNNTQMNNPSGLAFDSSKNLWVANVGSSALVMFPSAALAAGGNLTPGEIISGGTTTLNAPQGLVFH